MIQPRFGRLELQLPQGRPLVFSGPNDGPQAHLQVKSWKALPRLLFRGDLGFAEAHIDGLVDSPDMATFIQWACLNQESLATAFRGTWLTTAWDRLRHHKNENTREGSRRNIQAHYDLGNDFYSLWLDQTMTYSSAIFTEDTQGQLELAQKTKYRRILKQLDLTENAHVLEIGCGWGGFIEELLKNTKARITGITISEKQYEWTRERIRQLGEEGRAEVLLTDYRDIKGHFDRVVSIEMIEAVGERFWPTYFSTIRSRLKDGGRALIQAITIADEHLSQYLKSTDFIQQYIFPGGALLSPEEIERQAARQSLVVKDQHLFRLSYAETLRQWRERFNQKAKELDPRKYDTRFKRIWNLYLSYCEGAFRAGRIDVGQYLLLAPPKR